MKTTMANGINTNRAAQIPCWYGKHRVRDAIVSAKWKRKKKEVPSAKMKIRIFYLLQDCYEYKFMFEYNIKMYNSHLIFVLCARSHLYETHHQYKQKEPKPNPNRKKTQKLEFSRNQHINAWNGSCCITNNKHSHYAMGIDECARGEYQTRDERRKFWKMSTSTWEWEAEHTGHRGRMRCDSVVNVIRLKCGKRLLYALTIILIAFTAADVAATETGW